MTCYWCFFNIILIFRKWPIYSITNSCCGTGSLWYTIWRTNICKYSVCSWVLINCILYNSFSFIVFTVYFICYFCNRLYLLFSKRCFGSSFFVVLFCYFLVSSIRHCYFIYNKKKNFHKRIIKSIFASANYLI